MLIKVWAKIHSKNVEKQSIILQYCLRNQKNQANFQNKMPVCRKIPERRDGFC